VPGCEESWVVMQGSEDICVMLLGCEESWAMVPGSAES
jgi:hypothetical protein